MSGAVAKGFEGVATAFERAVAASPRGGAALSIRVEGRTVVNLAGGTAVGGAPWTPSTPTVLFSCSKGLLTLAMARLVEDGRLDLDAPVADYWPEFARAGKARVTVRCLMSHRAGLSFSRRDLTKADVLDWDRMASTLAAQEPLWEPGSGWAYHALTFGWLVGEIARRATGLPLREAFATLVSGPLGADAWFGVPVARERDVPAIAPMPPTAALMLRAWPGASGMRRALTLGGAFPLSLVGKGTGFNDPDIRRAEVPGAGAIGTAAALADIWSSAVVDSPHTRALDPRVAADMSAAQTSGAPVWGMRGLPSPRWGTGFLVDSPARPLLSPASFGHDGAGGQLAFADPTYGVGFGFVTNDMRGDDRRALGILDALRTALA